MNLEFEMKVTYKDLWYYRNGFVSKVDKIHQELKTEIQGTKQEVLAAVKFSYAELDKRITTLEKEFLELKHRVEKIETRSISWI